MLHAKRTIYGTALTVALLLSVLEGQALGQPPDPPRRLLPQAANGQPDVPAATTPSILGPETRPIDFDSALRLAGVRNPELMIARERLTEAAAVRQFAAAQLLPNI